MISIRKTNCAIQRIDIYPIDSVILIHLVYIWGRFNIFVSHHHFARVGRYWRKIPPMKADEIRTPPATSQLRNFCVERSRLQGIVTSKVHLKVDGIINFEWHRMINWESRDFFHNRPTSIKSKWPFLQKPWVAMIDTGNIYHPRF